MKQDMTMTHPLGCVCYTATGGALLPPGAYRLTDLASGVKIDVIIHAAHVDDEVSLPEHLRTAEFDAAWKLWIKSKRKKPSKPAIVMQTNRLAAMTHDDAIASIKQSIEKGWATFYPPHSSGPPRAAGTMPDTTIDELRR